MQHYIKYALQNLINFQNNYSFDVMCDSTEINSPKNFISACKKFCLDGSFVSEGMPPRNRHFSAGDRVSLSLSAGKSVFSVVCSGG